MFSLGMSFGEAAGLYDLPHTKSYKALSVVDIMRLQKKKWNYLLKYFPASKEVIFKRAIENGIKRPKNIRDQDTYLD